MAIACVVYVYVVFCLWPVLCPRITGALISAISYAPEYIGCRKSLPTASYGSRDHGS